MSKSDQIHLLLVDDEPDQLEIMGISLEQKAYPLAIETANTPEKALELIHSNLFDCIVCNYTMPRFNGVQLCERLRQEGDRTPFMLFTSHDDERLVGEARAAGVNDYLMKSPDITVYDLLVKKVQALVVQRRAEEALIVGTAQPA